MQHSLCTILTLLPLLLLPESAPAAASDEGEQLRSNIISLDRVVTNTLELSAYSPNTRNNSELVQFILFLRSRVDTYCRELEGLEGHQALEGLPCLEKADMDFPALLPPSESPTASEEIGRLDRELTQSLGDFDDMLLQEETKIAGSRPQSSGKSGGRASSGQTGAGSQSGMSGMSDDKSAGEEGSREQGTLSESGLSPQQTAGSSQTRGNIPQNQGGDGRLSVDDDIVAKQLREAAEKEKDPVLKEKLWQEYWKYKGKKL